MKERKKVIKSVQTTSGALLLDTVVKHLLEELHMQHYHDKEELMISLLHSSKEDMERICAGLVDTFIYTVLWQVAKLESTVTTMLYHHMSELWPHTCIKYHKVIM